MVTRDFVSDFNSVEDNSESNSVECNSESNSNSNGGNSNSNSARAGLRQFNSIPIPIRAISKKIKFRGIDPSSGLKDDQPLRPNKTSDVLLP